MSNFDPEVFLQTEIDSNFETSYTPVPKGEYSAYIDKIEMREVKDSAVLRVVWAIPDETLAQTLGVEKATVNDDLFLDIEDDGRLQFGPNKNIRLGRLREALNQNQPGQPWSFRTLNGAGPVMILVGERYGKNGEGPFATVDKIRKP